MEFARTLIINEILDLIEATCQEFIKVKKIPDSVLVTTAFYAAIEAIIKKEPHPDTVLQEELLAYLTAVREESTSNIIEEVTSMFFEVSNRQRV